jgi:hypothetical protein
MVSGQSLLSDMSVSFDPQLMLHRLKGNALGFRHPEFDPDQLQHHHAAEEQEDELIGICILTLRGERESLCLWRHIGLGKGSTHILVHISY